MRVAILGYGQLGRALSAALAPRTGAELRVWTRSPVASGERIAPIEFTASDSLARVAQWADLLWLAVSDRALGELAHALATLPVGWKGKTVLHSSGALGPDVLGPLASRGARVAVCHPLRAFPAPRGACGFEGAPFTLEGDPAALDAAGSLVVDLGGVALPAAVRDRALYHLAASVASNYGLLVRDWARARFQSAGLSSEDAGRAADALLRNALDNALAAPGGLPSSGPIRRGDVETVRLHLSRLRGTERLAYAALGLLLLEALGRAGAEGGADERPGPEAPEGLAEELRRAAEASLAEEARAAPAGPP